MKPSWGWIFAWIAVVCLLRSLVLQVSMTPASSFEQPSVWPRESRSPLSCQSLRVLREGWIRGRVGPQDFFFTSDVLLRAEDLDPTGPPWLILALLRLDIGTLGDLSGCRSRKSRRRPSKRGIIYASRPNFPRRSAQIESSGLWWSREEAQRL